MKSVEHQIVDFLERSISAYESLLELYVEVEQCVAAGAGADALHALMVRLDRIAGRAMEADAAFQENAAGAGEHLLEIPMFDQWLALLSRVIDENHRINKYLRSAMAMTKDDLTQLKKSKTAVTGYHSGEGRVMHTGRRINYGA